MDYGLHIITLIGIYAALAVSLSLVAGQIGLLSIAHAAVYGIGAYTTAILVVSVGMPVIGGLACAMVVAAAASIPLGVAASRLNGERFVLVTLGYQVFATSMFENWGSLTGGPLGIAGVSHSVLNSWFSSASVEFAMLSIGFAGLTILVSKQLSRGPFGRLLHCIRDDEVVAMSLGKSVGRVKFQVLATSSALAGGAGGLYAAYATFIDPYSFTLNESIAIAAMAIVGGIRTIWGPVLGATVLVLLPEALRFGGLPHTVAAPLQQAIFGGALVWIVMNRPQGILGPAGKEALGRTEVAGGGR